MDSGKKFDVSRLGSPLESTASDRDRDRGPPPRYGDDIFDRKFIFESLSMTVIFILYQSNNYYYQYIILH